MYFNKLILALTLVNFIYSIGYADSSNSELKDSIKKLEGINSGETQCYDEKTPWLGSYSNANDDKNCTSGSGDPYEPGARSISGADKGKCLSSTGNRPVKILSPKEAKKYGFTPSKDKIVIANLNHLNKFYVAEVPLDQVDDVILNVVMFKKVMKINIGHAHMRVKMKKPVVFKEQHPNTGKTLKTDELVLSLQAIASGGQFDPINKGRDGSYSSALGAYTLDSKLKIMHDNNFEVKQYALNLTNKEKRQYVEGFLKKGDKLGLGRKYSSFRDNCGNVQVEILDGIRKSNWKQKIFKNLPGARYGDLNPAAIRNTLGARGFIKGNLPNMRQDPTVAEKNRRYAK
jgi:hypothetical protein